MKIHSRILFGAVLGLSLATAHAQPGGARGGMMGGGPHGPQFNAAMAKIFGDNSAFSATLDMDMKMNEQTMSMPGKIAYDDTKSRFDMDMTEMKSSMIPASAMAQMKAMGMDKIVLISRPDKKITYMIYPGLEGYIEIQTQDPDAGKSGKDFKLDVTKLGEEKVDGHPCIKNQAVVTDDKGEKHEYTVWNATDMKKFPVKLETTDSGNVMTMVFKDVKLSKPDATLFDPPTNMKKYDQAGLQQEMMKRIMGSRGGMGGPPGGTPPGGPAPGGN